MGYRVLPHPADTGIEATSGSLAGLLVELARGMFALMAPLPPEAAHRWVEIEVESPSLPDLLVDVLSVLLYTSEVEGLMFCDFEVDQPEPAWSAKVRAGGVPADSVELSGPPIKAVTYHRLAVEEEPSGWYGRVFFDV